MPNSPKFDTDRVSAQSLITEARERVADAGPDNAEATLNAILTEWLQVVPSHLRTKLLLSFTVGLLAALTVGETKDELAEFRASTTTGRKSEL
jgi:hypothetical protein